MSDDPTLDAITESAEALGMKVAFVYKPTKADQEAAAARIEAKDKALDDLSGVAPRALVEFNPLSRRRRNAWDDRADKLWLLTPAELDMVPDGTVLVGIHGRTAIKGSDYIDDDTRGGYIAYGFLDSQLPPVPKGAA